MSIRKNVQDIVIPSEERHIRMYPMDFEEFLWAKDELPLLDLIKERFEKRKPLGQALHRRAITLFREYLIVGGMPQAVSEYLRTKDFEATDTIKRDILTLYRADIAKHAPRYEKKVEGILDELPSQLSKHEKKFSLSSLGRGTRFRDYESASLWLEDSMLVNMCYNSTEPNLGLKLNRDSASFKMYMGNTGLLISHAFDENSLVSEEIYRKLLFDKLDVNEGMILENTIAQMLTATGRKLYFYSSTSRTDKNRRMEIDFLIAKSKITSQHNVSPIEVKSGKRYTLSSIRKYIKQYGRYLDTPMVIHMDDLREEEGILYIPAYMTMCL